MLFFKKKKQADDYGAVQHFSVENVLNLLDRMTIMNIGDIVWFVAAGKKCRGYVIDMPTRESSYRPVVQEINDNGTIGPCTYVAPQYIISIEHRNIGMR